MPVRFSPTQRAADVNRTLKRGRTRTAAATIVTKNPVKEPSGFRAIQYLGSKLRLLDPIKDAIDEVRASDAPVVDLFSGTGVVAHHLSHTAPVVAVDIQQYARALADALVGRRSGSGPVVIVRSKSKHILNGSRAKWRRVVGVAPWKIFSKSSVIS